MDKKQFEALCDAAVNSDEEAGIIAANKVINKVFPNKAKLDIAKVSDAYTVGAELVGAGEVGGKVGDGTGDSVATIGKHTGSGKTFGIAFLRALIEAIKAKALDRFLAEPVVEKTKDGNKRDGLGSPAGFGRTSVGRHY